MHRNVMKIGVLSLALLLPDVAGAQDVAKKPMPLVIVDGVIADAMGTQALYRIDPADIASIDVIKGAAATELYGARAAGGVIMVRTKANPAQPELTEGQRQWTEFVKELRTQQPAQEPAPVTARARPLIVVDGVILGRAYPVSLDALKDRIERIEVIKGPAAAAAFGAAGAEGVIVITTKRVP